MIPTSPQKEKTNKYQASSPPDFEDISSIHKSESGSMGLKRLQKFKSFNSSASTRYKQKQLQESQHDKKELLEFLKQADGKYHHLSRRQINEMNKVKVPTAEKIRRSLVKAFKLEPYMDQLENTNENIDDSENIAVLSKRVSNINADENQPSGSAEKSESTNSNNSNQST